MDCGGVEVAQDQARQFSRLKGDLSLPEAHVGKLLAARKEVEAMLAASEEQSGAFRFVERRQ